MPDRPGSRCPYSEMRAERSLQQVGEKGRRDDLLVAVDSGSAQRGGGGDEQPHGDVCTV